MQSTVGYDHESEFHRRISEWLNLLVQMSTMELLKSLLGNVCKIHATGNGAGTRGTNGMAQTRTTNLPQLSMHPIRILVRIDYIRPSSRTPNSFTCTVSTEISLSHLLAESGPNPTLRGIETPQIPCHRRLNIESPGLPGAGNFIDFSPPTCTLRELFECP